MSYYLYRIDCYCSYSDCYIGRTAIIEQLISFLRGKTGDVLSTADTKTLEITSDSVSPSSVESVPCEAPQLSLPTVAPCELSRLLGKLTSSVIQGSRKTLSELLQELCASILDLFQECSSICETEVQVLLSETALLNPTCKIVEILATSNGDFSELKVHLRGEIMLMAVRKDYGVRPKDVVPFEYCDLLSIAVWELNRISSFSESDQNIIKECQRNRSRYGNTVRAFLKVIDQLNVTPSLEDPKVSGFEEKANKAKSELEKVSFFLNRFYFIAVLMFFFCVGQRKAS